MLTFNFVGKVSGNPSAQIFNILSICAQVSDFILGDSVTQCLIWRSLSTSFLKEEEKKNSSTAFKYLIWYDESV